MGIWGLHCATWTWKKTNRPELLPIYVRFRPSYSNWARKNEVAVEDGVYGHSLITKGSHGRGLTLEAFVPFWPNAVGWLEKTDNPCLWAVAWTPSHGHLAPVKSAFVSTMVDGATESFQILARMHGPEARGTNTVRKR